MNSLYWYKRGKLVFYALKSVLIVDILLSYAKLAQLARALPCQGRGCEFESRISLIYFNYNQYRWIVHFIGHFLKHCETQ